MPASKSAGEKPFKGAVAEVTTGRTRDRGDIKESSDVALEGRENMERGGALLIEGKRSRSQQSSRCREERQTDRDKEGWPERTEGTQKELGREKRPH